MTGMMTWVAALRIASRNLEYANEAANSVDGESAEYARVAEVAVAYARELREATEGRSNAEVDRMMSA